MLFALELRHRPVPARAIARLHECAIAAQPILFDTLVVSRISHSRGPAGAPSDARNVCYRLGHAPTLVSLRRTDCLPLRLWRSPDLQLESRERDWLPRRAGGRPQGQRLEARRAQPAGHG